MTSVLKQARQQEEISCPYVGWSGGCDDCNLELEPSTCQGYKDDYYDTSL